MARRGKISISVTASVPKDILFNQKYLFEPSSCLFCVRFPAISRFVRCGHLTSTTRIPFVFLYHLNFEFPVGFKLMYPKDNNAAAHSVNIYIFYAVIRIMTYRSELCLNIKGYTSIWPLPDRENRKIWKL